MNLPYYDWRSIYTTNYDTLIEKTYQLRNKPYAVYRTNFDFGIEEATTSIKIYKLHGFIEEDISDGKNARIILTVGDYDLTDQYRELLFDSFRLQISSGYLLIIGHSLTDPDLRGEIDEVLRRRRESGATGRIFLLLYIRDENRALIYEDRGIQVCFGGLDEFFSEMVNKLPPTQLAFAISEDPLDVAPVLRPCTIDVSHSLTVEQADVLKMCNGQSATYADVSRGWTFDREIAGKLETQLVAADAKRIAYVLGAAGVGKTTAVRQALLNLSHRKAFCWEHKDEFGLSADGWERVNEELQGRGGSGVLFVDDCHAHMREINRLVDSNLWN